MTERKEADTEWLRVTNAARRIGIPRTTLIHRIAKGEYETKTIDDTLFVALPVGVSAEPIAA